MIPFSLPLFPGAGRAMLLKKSVPVCVLGQVASWDKCEVGTHGVPSYAKAPLAWWQGDQETSWWMTRMGRQWAGGLHPSVCISLLVSLSQVSLRTTIPFYPFGYYEVDPWEAHSPAWPTRVFRPSGYNNWFRNGHVTSQNFPKSNQERGTPFLGGWGVLLSW